MEKRVIWIHGIGLHQPGYSAEWRDVYSEYLKLPDAAYLEVCWDTVFHAARQATRAAPRGARRGAASAVDPLALLPREQEAEQEVREELETILLARASAQDLAQPRPQARGAGGRSGEGVIEWREAYGAPRRRGAVPRGTFDWFFNSDEYLGDFAKYIVSRNIRNAVKEKAKEQLRTLVDGSYHISIIAHSWGTVVAYESLIDLHSEVPALKVGNLITLGSPLWAVRPFLDDRTGEKPNQTTTWLNIHARGDPVGSWLSRGFRVDKEWEVPNFGGGGPHSSYFVANNEAVQRDLIAPYVLAEV